jgi:dTDP-L-rhamnose 4-epimerase
MSPKKGLVLVTGGAGFIGSHTVDKFIEKGFSVRIMDNLTSHEGKWPKYVNKKAQKVIGDVTNILDWEKALIDVTYVVHLAGIMDFHLEFSRFFQNNTVGTANLYEVIVKNSLPVNKVVIASTQFVYGYGRWKCKTHAIVHPKEVSDMLKKQKHWDPVCPICSKNVTYLKNKEDHVDPPNQYAISKYTQELIGLKLGKTHNVPTVALRYSIVHGPRQNIKNPYSGALRIFAIQMLANRPITLFEDGKNLRDFVSVYDVANANYLATIKPKSDYNVYNVGGGKAYTINQLADMIANKLNKKLLFSTGSFRQGDIRHAVSDISKIKEIGWKPIHTEEESIEKFIKWLKIHKTSSDQVGRTLTEMRQKGIVVAI